MKKITCLLLSGLLILSFAGCSTKPEKKVSSASAASEAASAAESTSEAAGAWSRDGIFMDEEGHMVTVTWLDYLDEPSWYAGVLLGDNWEEDSWTGNVEQKGNSLYGVLASNADKDDMTVTITEEGETGLVLAIEGGETYHVSSDNVPKATINVMVNVEGLGYIEYAEGDTTPELDPEFKASSAVINLAEPEVYTLLAYPAEDTSFVKWTKNGEDFSTEAQITLTLDESAEYIAVFEFN